MSHPLHQANRLSWNAATLAHNRHKGDQAAFFRAGGSTLFPDELELLGDLAGQRVVHLQCNAGQDTLSLVHHGATVTGVDISDTALQFARQLSADSGIPATFIEADVLDWLHDPATPAAHWDCAFASYGALCWLADLEPWARGVARILKPGGRLVVLEFHPVLQMLDEGFVLKYPYSSAGASLEWPEGVGDYVALSGGLLVPMAEGAPSPEAFVNPHGCHEWEWGIADVLTPILAAGLRLEVFREYFHSNGYRPWEGFVEAEGRRWVPPPEVPRIPLMYGLVASLTP